MRRGISVVIVAAAVLATACTSSAESAEPEEVPQSAPDTTEAEQDTPPDDNGFPVVDQEIDWSDCLGIFQCATVLVPLDYADPEGETTGLAVTRWSTRDRANRVGTLFVNPGGPGFGAQFFVDSVIRFGPFELGERFDVVGIDPRGTGGSNPIDCNTDWEEDINTPLTEEDGLADDVQAYVEDFEDMAAECLSEYGQAYLSSITTENAARDHESIRILLGDEPMNFMGASYGTTLGSVYATMFPDNIRSLVLDGAVLPDAGLLSPDEYPDFQLQLDRLDASCEAWSDCPLSEGWVEAADELEKILTAGPIGPLTLGDFYNTFGLTYAAPSFMADVAFGMAEALDGDGASLASLSNNLLTPLDGTGNPAEYAGGLEAIHCADDIRWSQVASADLLEVADATAASNAELGPFFGIPCDLWPVQGDGLPAIDYRSDAPVLVIGNTGDAITPLRYAVEMADAFGDQARLLTWDATGHVAFSFGSNCIDNFTLAYLVHLTLPAVDTVCPLEGTIGVELEPDLAIIQVVPGTPAALAGIEAGDRIIAINGVATGSFDDFPALAAGESVQVELERGDDVVAIDVVPEPPEWELWRLTE